MELSHYYAVKSYSNIKGVKQYYSLLGGIMGLYGQWDGKDRCKVICDEVAKSSDVNMIVSNMINTDFGTVFVSLISHEAIRDFLMKETEYTKRDISNGVFPTKFGFGQENGQKGLNSRAVFTDFFIYDRIKSLYDPMNKIINTHFNEFIKNKKIKRNEFTQINLHDFFCGIMLDWTSLLLFGCESSEELNIDLTKYPEITKRTHFSKFFENKKQENIIKIIVLYAEMTTNQLFDPILMLTGGWLYFFSVMEIHRDYKALIKFLDKIIYDFYEKRYNEYVKIGAKSKYTNIIDLMIEHNFNCIKDNNHKDFQDKENIIGNIIVLAFAGFDTSLQASTSCIIWTSKNHQDWIDRIKNEGVENLDQIKVNCSLELVIKETLRLYSPALASFPRVVIKDMVISGVKIPRGSMLNVATGINKWNDRFIDAKKFRPERYETEVPKLKYYEYIPFYEGRRKCLGYNFALMNMRLMIGYTINTFELKVDDGFEIIMDKAVYQCSNPLVKIKLRN